MKLNQTLCQLRNTFEDKKMKPSILLSVLLFTQGSFAQEMEMLETPEEAHLRMSKISFDDTKELVKEMHPGELRKFRKTIVRFMKVIPEDSREIFIETLFGAEATLEQLEAMSDQKVYAAFLDTANQKFPREARAQMRSMKTKAIGHVLEGNEKAHIVVRTSLAATGFTRVSVVTFRRYKGRWLGAILEDTESRLNGIARQLLK